MKSNSRTKKLRDQVEVSQGVGEKGLAIDISYHHKVGEKDHQIMVVLRLMWVKLVLCLTVNEFKKWIKTALRLIGDELQKIGSKEPHVCHGSVYFDQLFHRTCH